MKTIILLFITILLISSCEEHSLSIQGHKIETDYNIIIIDKCEYIEIQHYVGSNIGIYSISHKGNCKNLEHK